MQAIRINSVKLGESAGPYSHAVRYDNTLYTSGMTAFSTSAEKEDVSSQLHAIFHQLSVLCIEQKTSLKKLIKVTIFITDPDDVSAIRNTLYEIYGEHLPASSLVQVKALFSETLKVEVEAVVGV